MRVESIFSSNSRRKSKYLYSPKRTTIPLNSGWRRHFGSLMTLWNGSSFPVRDWFKVEFSLVGLFVWFRQWKNFISGKRDISMSVTENTWAFWLISSSMLEDVFMIRHKKTKKRILHIESTFEAVCRKKVRRDSGKKCHTDALQAHF